MTRMTRKLRAVLAAPALAGVLVVVGLATWAGRRDHGDDADLGDLRRAEAVESFIEHRFASELTRMQIGIVATAVALGLMVGLVAEVLVRLQGKDPDAALEDVGRRGFVGTPEEIVAKMRPFVDAGMDLFLLQHFLLDDTDALRLLSEEVVPALR